MAAFTNLSFETAGAAAGEAAGWTVSTLASLQAFADFSGTTEATISAVDGFGWEGDATYEVTGTPLGTYDFYLELNAGVLGSTGAQYAWSTNGGIDMTPLVGVPLDGVIVLGATGVTLTFLGDPGDSLSGYLSWATTAASSGPGYPRVLESFEADWGVTTFLDEVPTPSIATFDALFVSPARTVEQFDFWFAPGQTLFLRELAAAEEGLFGGLALESFEAGWGVTAFLDELDPMAIEENPIEQLDVSGYLTAFGPGDTSGGTFSTGLDIESFEFIFTPLTYSVSAGSDVFKSVGHGRLAGQPVLFTTTGTLPAPLEDGVVYFLRDVTADEFKVAATIAGPAIDITTTGTGVQTVTGDPTVYWTATLS